MLSEYFYNNSKCAKERERERERGWKLESPLNWQEFEHQLPLNNNVCFSTIFQNLLPSLWWLNWYWCYVMFPSLFECQWKKTDINFKLIFSLKTWLFPTLPHKLENMPPDFTQRQNGHYDEPTVKIRLHLVF